MQLTRPRLIALFMTLAALGSWLPVLWLHRNGLDWTTPQGRAVSVWYAFPVLLTTLFLQTTVLKQPVAGPLGLTARPTRWWLLGWLLPVAVLGIGLAMLSLLGYEPVTTLEQLIANKRAQVPAAQLPDFEAYLLDNRPPHPIRLVLMGLPAGLTFNLVPALAEEVGFRGFLFREMPGGFWARALGIGVLWWIWLVPAVWLGHFYPDRPTVAPAVALAWCLIVSVVLVYIRARAASLIPVALARSTMLALTAAAIDLSHGSPYLLRPFYGVGGIVGFVVVLCALLAHDRFGASQRLAT